MAGVSGSKRLECRWWTCPSQFSSSAIFGKCDVFSKVLVITLLFLFSVGVFPPSLNNETCFDNLLDTLFFKPFITSLDVVDLVSFLFLAGEGVFEEGVPSNPLF
jgi:hypothetical protein